MFRIIGVIFWQILSVATLIILTILFQLDINLTIVAMAGALAGGFIWLLQDLNQGRRYLNWLRNDSQSSFPIFTGRWVDVANRTKRLIQDQNRNLKSSNQRLDDFLAAIQASPNGVILIDKNGQIEWCNLTAANHFGLNAEADVMQHIGNLVREPNFISYFNAGKYTEPLTINILNATSHKSIRLGIQIHRYGIGKKLILSNDVTAIEMAEIMRKDFVANVSHEIRTPMTVLSGFVETLQSIKLDEEERVRYLDLMQKQTHRIQLLVNDLLMLSKIEGNPLPSPSTWVKVSELIDSCKIEAEALNTDAENLNNKRKHSIQFVVDTSLEFAGSQSELLSAMCNLINNAVRYTPAGGEIHIDCTGLSNGGAMFSVIDSGLGILPEHLPRLTERFYRVDASRSRESGGTGLGLAIVKHVVQRHGGELKISSVFGSGSTFSFILPSNRVRFSDSNVSLKTPIQE